MVHSFLIEPDTYTAFSDEAELIDQCKEWGLLSDKAAKIKIFYYKGHGLNETCSIIGYVDHITAVIQLGNHQKHCIHPSYLKEMQASSYGVKAADTAEAPEVKANEPTSATADTTEAKSEDTLIPTESKAKEEADNLNSPLPKAADKASKSSSNKAKRAKLELPEGKVKIIATVKEFTTIPNHFSDNDDEVVIYENTTVIEPEIEIGDAWSSHSATVKKAELEIGDTVAFEAKIVAKKLTKHPVRHKLNNVTKIEKQPS